MCAFGFAGIGLLGDVVRLRASQTEVLAENDSLRRQFVRLDQLEREIARMALIDNQMRVLAGVETTDPTTPALPDSQRAVVGPEDSRATPGMR